MDERTRNVWHVGDVAYFLNGTQVIVLDAACIYCFDTCRNPNLMGRQYNSDDVAIAFNTGLEWQPDLIGHHKLMTKEQLLQQLEVYKKMAEKRMADAVHDVENYVRRIEAAKEMDVK